MSKGKRKADFADRLINTLRLYPAFNDFWCAQDDGLQAEMAEDIADEFGDEIACGTCDGTPEAQSATLESIERGLLEIKNLSRQMWDNRPYDGTEQSE